MDRHTDVITVSRQFARTSTPDFFVRAVLVRPAQRFGALFAVTFGGVASVAVVMSRKSGGFR